MSQESKHDSVNCVPCTPSVVAVCWLLLPQASSVQGPSKSPSFSARWVWRWLRISFTSDACRRRSESALLADSTVVEFDAEVFGDVLDVDDEFGALFALFNTARNVPVEVEVNIE